MDITEHLKRIERAERLRLDLLRSMQEWLRLEPWHLTAVIAPDRHSWRLILNVDHEPPLDSEWNFIFGEAVHNLRASLDNVVIAMAKNAGIVDRDELRKFSFPTSKTAADWKKDQSRIKGLPNHYRQAIGEVQPYQRAAAEISGDLLLILRDLSNADTHYIQVTAKLKTQEVHHLMSVQFETDADADASVPPDTTFFSPSFQDGEELLLHRTVGRIANVRGSCDVHAQLLVELPDGRHELPTDLIGWLCYYTRLVMNHIASATPTSHT